MYETSGFFYSVITFSYTKCFVHSYTVDVVFTLSYKRSPATTKRAVNNSEQEALESAYINLLGVAVEYIIKDGSFYVDTDSAFGLVGLRVCNQEYLF